MKKIFLFATIVALSFAVMPANAQSRKDKKAAKKEAWERDLQRQREEEDLKHKMKMQQLQKEQQQADEQAAMAAAAQGGTRVITPCKENSFDDELYFRDYGVGTHLNEQSARTAAMQEAKNMIKGRLGEFVQGLTSSYFNSYAGTKPSADVQRKTENKLNGVVARMLNDADKICEETLIDRKGNYKAYYAIQISKGDLKKNMTEALSSDEKLGIDFNEFKFQKFMDEKMGEMLKAKQQAGY